MSSALRLPPISLQQHFREVTSHQAIKGRDVTLRLLKKTDFLPERSAITSASVVPFIGKDKIVAPTLQRGIDIPGGHIEASDRSLASAVKREAYEEARIFLVDPLYVIGIIESNYNPERTTYMLIAAGRVSGMDDFVVEFEAIGREIVTASEFMHRYAAGPREMMEELIRRAEAMQGNATI